MDGAVSAEFVGGPLDGTLRWVPNPPTEFYTFGILVMPDTPEAIERGEATGSAAVYRLARDAEGMPWFTPQAQVRYDWQGYRVMTVA